MRSDDSTLGDRIAGTLVGAIAGCLLLGCIGSCSDSLITGVLAGSVVGGLLGYWSTIGRVSPEIVGGTFGAFLFAAAGPAVDDHSGAAVLPGAILGSLVGRWFRSVREFDG